MDIAKIARSSSSNGISNLPCDVINNILNRIPLDEAVRTSILSREWRYKWLTIPNLVFDTKLRKKLIGKEKLESIINRVLVFHKGPIDRFKLELADFDSIPAAINHWIRFLSNHQVREFDLSFSSCSLTHTREYYALPFDLFASEKLTRLCLSGCELELPSASRGFANLVSLELEDVRIAPEKFASFISNCPLIKYLWLEDCTEFEALEIDAPNLKSFHFIGEFRSVSFKNTSLLREVSIKLEYLHPDCQHSNMVEVFAHSPSLVRLELDFLAVQFLSIGGPPEKPLHSFNQLKAFQFFDIGFESYLAVSSALCLIRSSPNLESLEIDLETKGHLVEEQNEVLQFLKAQEKSKISLNRLKNVQMEGFQGLEPEMEFVKLLLTAATTLEKLEIWSENSIDTKQVREILKGLTRFRRASSEAEIIFMEPK